jgi:heme oxygenase (biliverdin-IX-beta and delta-forming)
MLFDLLREATDWHHRRIEGSPRMTSLMSGSLDDREYAEHLVDLHAFFHSFEAAVLDQHPDVSARFSYDRRLKTPLIEKDLHALGCSLPAESQHFLWQLDSVEDAIGFLYVVEGATLGGRFVARHVENTAGVSPDATNYFRSYGSERGVYWNAFKENAQALFEERMLDADAVVDAAIEMFECLEGWMNDGTVSQRANEGLSADR